MGAADTKLDLAERERLRHEQPGSGLEQRLARLSDEHPSSSAYADQPARNGDGRESERVRPLTDAEYADHVSHVEARLDQARAAGLATSKQHTIDRGGEFWSDEREARHDEIVDDIYSAARGVPCEFHAIIAGGLAGAGKTTVLREHAGLDLSQYFVINPDAIKKQFADRSLVPHVDGLSPMEASALVHEESSYIAKRLALRAQGEGKNVIWDITMSSGASTGSRVDLLRAAGYVRIEGVFVDIPIGLSERRAEARHREGHEEFVAGRGLGGRYVPSEMITAQSDPEWGSQNRRNFEDVKHKFDAWSVYDNSVDGRSPRLVATSQPDDHERRMEAE